MSHAEEQGLIIKLLAYYSKEDRAADVAMVLLWQVWWP